MGPPNGSWGSNTPSNTSNTPTNTPKTHQAPPLTHPKGILHPEKHTAEYMKPLVHILPIWKHIIIQFAKKFFTALD